MNGNSVTKNDSTGITTYAWDFENRLTSVTLPGSAGTVSFKYDPFGRRIYKSSSSGTSIYAYDLDNLVEETNAAGAVVARYQQGLNIDEPLPMLRSGVTSYYQVDGLSSTTSLSSSAGALAQLLLRIFLKKSVTRLALSRQTSIQKCPHPGTGADAGRSNSARTETLSLSQPIFAKLFRRRALL